MLGEAGARATAMTGMRNLSAASGGCILACRGGCGSRLRLYGEVMAEMIAISLSAKVAATLSGSAAADFSSLVAVRSGIAAAARDLELLRAFLRFADSRRGEDALASAWVDQIRDVEFELEDVADEYAFLSGGGFVRACANFGAWLALARRLGKARVRLRDLSDAKERYGIRPAEATASSSAPDGGTGPVVGRKLAEAAHFLEDGEIVGFAAHRRSLMKWLTEDIDSRRSLVAVCGMGGVGKTTLVTSVYKEVAASRHFDCAAWVSVSKNFTTDDLLRKIAKELHRDVRAGMPDIDEMDYRSLVEALRGHLAKKRYLLLLDDVWDADAWYEIRNALVDDGQGSKIIITTRSHDVASLAASTRIIMLEPLPKQEAWSLFCNTTFREDANQECPHHLEQWAFKILDRCCGLPLAIVSVGNLLALKSRTEFAWKNVHDSLDWDGSSVRGIGQVSSILNLSIDDLPYHLKRCLLYCSIYPEDFLIKRKILIRLWIAEGYIEEKGQGTMEEIADDYLHQLVQRSLLQVTLKNEFGRAKRLCIHDLIRDLILQRSIKEGFTVFSKCQPTLGPSKKIRHLILDRWIDKLPSSLSNLLNLRYLGIRSTLIEELPQDLGQLRKLQTLDTKWSRVQRLPPSIRKLNNLRHLIVFRRRSADFRFAFPGTAIEFPDGLQNLTCLQTLKYIEADEKMVKSLKSLKHMKSLELSGVHESNLIHLPSSISTMSGLLCLGIVSRDANVILDLEPFYPPPLKLQRLSLTGMLARGKLPSWFGHLDNLMQLRLCSSELRGDSIGLLSSLPRLLHLTLKNAYTDKSLSFPEGSFPVLKKLSLHELPNLSHIEFQKGSLLHLNVLILGRCDELTEIPQGIENLIELDNLELYEMPSEIIEKIQDRETLVGDYKDSRRTTTVKNTVWYNGQLLQKTIYTNLFTIQI
ncbi:hypothetical protein ZWY2020_013594 [Hordeum vulgare]|nr:hypothetical protein ZWY2020_013594 [Hordeum vulgare]